MDWIPLPLQPFSVPLKLPWSASNTSKINVSQLNLVAYEYHGLLK
jgi:hypothetical protein